MAMIITHNTAAINTQRNLSINNRNLGKSLEKLSSGYRINVGADGPADLIISEQLRAQNVGLQRAVQNTQEAMNVIGIAEGALNEMNEILKKMRSLALHAANSGITSPTQVAADQAEVDSAIQTIDRIANTTKYSDQFLLNGGKGLVYDRSTVIDGTDQNSLLDLTQTNITQIFKTEGQEVGFSFVGVDGTATNSHGTADVGAEARKAYFEIDTNLGNPGDIDTTDNTLSASQSFILTGNQGSRQFSFGEGATMGQIASAINNVADSTGVEASLIFDSSEAADAGGAVGVTGVVVGGAGARAATTLAVFNKDDVTKGVTANTVAMGVVAGKNTDGQGRIWIKYTGATTAELYKDESLSRESLVGTAASGVAIVAQNNSGLTGTLTIADGLAAEKHEYLAVSGLLATAANGTESGCINTAGGANQFDSDTSLFSGIELGQNTDSEGKIYFKVDMASATTGTVYAYKDSQMRDEDLVAQSDPDAPVSLAATRTVILNEVRNAEDTAGTGLGIALTTGTLWAGTAGTDITGSFQFDNVGVRISSSDYGSDSYVRLQQQTGTVWNQYKQADSSDATLVQAGQTIQENGADATVSINGMQVKTNGLELELATQDVQGSLVFNEGKVGSTTIAQVGYSEGSVYSKAGSLTDTATGVGAYLTNAGHTTTEKLNHFVGGMQFQLGEGAGDQERMVYSIESTAVSNLGQTEFTAQFDDTVAVIESKSLSLQDVLGGGLASLGSDPIKALSIIDNAINDVSSLRARLGATQSNMLQTNANSLQVAIENIQKTESLIRDADMAAETTDFTKNQILMSAGTSMLAQANVMSQNVLQLLG